MKLSFSIPAHNEEKNIWRCLDSIFRELEGKNYQVEVIVVDNASTDRTAEIAKSYGGVRVVAEPHKGLLFARERGRLTATGELLANFDADAILTPGWIDTVFKEFENDPELVALSGPFVFYDGSWLTALMTKVFYILGFALHGLSLLITRRGTLLQGGNFILRKDALDKIGGFDTTISFYGEDTDMARRIRQMGKIKFLWHLKAQTSARRLMEEGLFTAGFRYVINHLWVLFFKKPYTASYRDIRSNPNAQ